MESPWRAAGHHIVCPASLATDPRPGCGARFVLTARPAFPRAVHAVEGMPIPFGSTGQPTGADPAQPDGERMARPMMLPRTRFRSQLGGSDRNEGIRVVPVRRYTAPAPGTTSRKETA